MLKEIQVSSGGVRGVWSRHGLLIKHERLLRLEKSVAKRNIELSDDQIRLLERFSPEFRERHIETRYTGDLVAVDISGDGRSSSLATSTGSHKVVALGWRRVGLLSFPVS